MNKLRKAFTIGVMSLTVLSMSVVVAPQTKAAQAGDLIKMDGLSSVYYLGADNKRYVFPNEATYFSWYSDFSGVVTVSQSELESYPLGANVTIRPGTKLVKITTNPTVYAVEPGGNLVAIPDEATAKALYGDNWNKRIVDVPDAFFTNYTITSKTASATAYPTGSLVKFGDNPDVYYIDADGKARKFADEAAFLANRFKWSDVITSSLDLPELGAEITGAESALTDTSSGAGGTAEAGTGVSVSLASDTPGAQSVPSSATGVVATKFNLTAANDGDVVVNGLTVKRTGVGETSEVSKVYIYDGATRLTTGKSVNASTNESVFNNLNVTIPAGTTKTLSIVVDFAASASGNHAFGIESASNITTNGAVVSGSFPVRGNVMALSTTSVGKADVESSGTDYTRKVGSNNVEVATFTVYVDSTEDAMFEGITLYNSGRDVLSNLKLYRGGTEVAEGVASGDYFVFALDTPYAIAKGESASFTVRGDVDGRDGDTATLYVRYSTDVKLVGQTYGYNLAIDVTEGSDSSNSYVDEVDSTPSSNTVTVEAGQLTISTDGPSASDISDDTNDVVLMNFSLSSETAVEISKASILLSDSSGNLTSSDINDLDLVCGGVIIDTVSAPSVATNTITETWTLEEGTTDCQIRVDIENNLDGDEKIKATLLDLTNTSYWTIRDVANNDTISDIVPSGNIAGNEMTITSASLTVAVASTPAAGQTYVKGADEAPITSFTFSAGDAQDVKVTSIKLEAYLSDDATTTSSWPSTDKNQSTGAEDVLVSVSIYDGNSTTPMSTKTLTVGSSDVYVTFDSLDWTIPAGEDKTLMVKADISTNGPKGGDNDTVAFAIASASSISAEYGTGTSLTPTISSGNTNPDIYQIIASSGSLTMTSDAGTPTSDLVIAGTDDVEFTKVKFSATNEAFEVTKLRVVNDRYSTVGDDEFVQVKLSYTDGDGTTQEAVKTLTGGVADFTGLSIYVPKDDKTVVTIKANLNTEADGADNGDYTSLKVDYNTEFEAIGQASGEKVTSAGSADVDGEDMYVYESIPSFAFASDTPSGNLTPSADTLLAKINITADAGEDITFENADGNSLTLAIVASRNDDASADDDSLTVKDEDGNTLCSTSTIDFDSATSWTCDFSSRSLTIAAGTTETVYVYGKTTDFEDDGDSIQLKLDDDSSTNVDWGIDGSGSYNHANILFRGDLYGGSLVKP